MSSFCLTLWVDSLGTVGGNNFNLWRHGFLGFLPSMKNMPLYCFLPQICFLPLTYCTKYDELILFSPGMFNVFTLATIFHRVTDLYRSKLNERHFSLETVISVLQSFPFFFSLPDAPISTVRYWYPLFPLFVWIFSHFPQTPMLQSLIFKKT